MFISKFATFDLSNMKMKPNVLYVNKKTEIVFNHIS